MVYNKQQKAEYYKKNKEKIAEQRKEYYEENKEKLKQKKVEYYNTENGKKINKINKWKSLGLICDDYDLIYEHYINTKYCDNPLCKVELTTDRYNTTTTRCLDHDHHTGKFRNVLCHPCNIKRG